MKEFGQIYMKKLINYPLLPYCNKIVITVGKVTVGYFGFCGLWGEAGMVSDRPNLVTER